MFLLQKLLSFYIFGAFRFILQTSTCKQTSHGHISVTLSCWAADFSSREGCAKANLFPVPVTATAKPDGIFSSLCNSFPPLMLKPSEDTLYKTKLTAVNPMVDDSVYLFSQQHAHCKSSVSAQFVPCPFSLCVCMLQRLMENICFLVRWEDWHHSCFCSVDLQLKPCSRRKQQTWLCPKVKKASWTPKAGQLTPYTLYKDQSVKIRLFLIGWSDILESLLVAQQLHSDDKAQQDRTC